MMPGVQCGLDTPVVSVLERLRQDDHEFKTNQERREAGKKGKEERKIKNS